MSTHSLGGRQKATTKQVSSQALKDKRASSTHRSGQCLRAHRDRTCRPCHASAGVRDRLSLLFAESSRFPENAIDRSVSSGLTIGACSPQPLAQTISAVSPPWRRHRAPAPFHHSRAMTRLWAGADECHLARLKHGSRLRFARFLMALTRTYSRRSSAGISGQCGIGFRFEAASGSDLSEAAIQRFLPLGGPRACPRKQGT